MIGIEAYYVGLVVLIALYIVGLYAVYKENVLGFVASGFATITTIVFTVLAGFGRVGNDQYLAVNSSIEHVTDMIDSSIVYLNGFISLMMVIVLLFIIGRYIASIVLMRKESEEE